MYLQVGWVGGWMKTLVHHSVNVSSSNDTDDLIPEKLAKWLLPQLCPAVAVITKFQEDSLGCQLTDLSSTSAMIS